MNTPQDRLARALVSLEGLSVGDAFGERFFLAPSLAHSLIEQRALPKPPWRWTDDTAMAVAIVDILGRYDAIDQDALAQQFAGRYMHEPDRGYAQGMHRLLPAIQGGLPWRRGAPQLFNGQGSFGNGAAMRVAPVGSYFADDLDAVVNYARQSAEITHTNPEGVAGAIAVALAAAIAWRWGQESIKPHPAAFLEAVLQLVPAGEVRKRIEQAQALPTDTSISSVVQVLGNGSQVSAQDTVPFALWCAAQHLDNYEEALWMTVSGLGDVDTTCAIVGGIVALYTGVEGIPAEWRASREPLPVLDTGELVDDPAVTVTLFRPVGPKELALIRESGSRAFPPRLPEQPIFYPVLTEAYAAQIARGWNVKQSGSGYVTRFAVRAAFLRRYAVQTVGSSGHQEYWIPAEELTFFNENIVGPIEVTQEFHPE